MTAPHAGAGFRDYLELTKPRLSSLAIFSTVLGYIAARPPWLPVEFLALLVGTSLAAGGVAALNQWLEADTDAVMHRTADRPIPAGKIPTGSAFMMGILMCCAALALIFALVNGVAAFCTLLTMVMYLACYTPAKRRSRWSTEIGAVAGALPVLIGTTGAEGGVSLLGWIMFGIVFFWQFPHVHAISWKYRRDYSAVKFPLLAVRDTQGHWMVGWALLSTVLLLAVSVLPAFTGLASIYYLVVAVPAWIWFFVRVLAFTHRQNRDAAAHRLFVVSIIYLPLVLTALAADRLIFAN